MTHPVPAPSGSNGPNPHGHGRPSDWVARFLAGVPSGGTVLDVACGAGRHLRLARERGHGVVGIDRDVSGLADLSGDPRVEIVGHDLEAEGGLVLPFAEDRRFAAIVVTNYLFRPLFPVLRERLAADGMLIWETFALGHERHGKPSNPHFLLAPNELLSPELVGGLAIVGYEQGEAIGPGGAPRIVQRLAAVGPAHPWAFAEPRPLD
jgi:SAM-dependent methyltransferase